MKAHTKVNYMQNLLKGVACILVILNHFHHNNTFIGNIEYTISHLAVPIFYLISGYYLWNGNEKREADRIRGKIIHTIKLLLLFISISLCFQILMSLYHTYSFGEFGFFLKTRLTIENIIRSFIISQTLFGRGEWFLWGMLEAYILIYLSYRIKPIQILRKHSIIVASLLLIVHVFVRWIIILLGIIKLGDIDLLASYSVRNVWFDALPFMIIGYGFHQKQQKYIEKLQSAILIMTTIIGIIIAIFESFILKSLNQNVECVLYIGIIISVISLFLLSIKNPMYGQGSIWEHIGANLSLITYLIHVEIESIIGNFAELLRIEKTSIYFCLYPVIVICCVLLVAQIFFWLNELYKQKAKKEIL